MLNLHQNVFHGIFQADLDKLVPETVRWIVGMFIDIEFVMCMFFWQ